MRDLSELQVQLSIIDEEIEAAVILSLDLQLCNLNIKELTLHGQHKCYNC